jgi:tetratricopeptide (TPR) repeat protein
MSAALQPLLDALQFSPDNLPLRQHLARQFNATGRHQEAEILCRKGLRQHPTDDALHLSLAEEAYFASNKHSAACVVVEELLDQRADHAAAHLLHARLLHARLLAAGQPKPATPTLAPDGKAGRLHRGLQRGLSARPDSVGHTIGMLGLTVAISLQCVPLLLYGWAYLRWRLAPVVLQLRGRPLAWLANLEIPAWRQAASGRGARLRRDWPSCCRPSCPM